MSTSYSVRWNFSQDVTLRMELGLTASQSIILNGQRFTSWKEWKSFLSHNRHNVEIFDEYGRVVSLGTLTQIVEGYGEAARRSHYEVMMTDKSEFPHPCRWKPSTRLGTCWLDDEGFTILNADFS